VTAFAQGENAARFLSGRGAIVTGGGRGIGASIAVALAGAGARVVVAARTRTEVERVAASLKAGGGSAWAVSCDVTDEESVRRMSQTARSHLGTIDILVNNAGLGGSAPLARIALSEWDSMIAVHATGTFLCTRELLPGMVERGFGRVINVASVAGLEGGKYIAHYAAAKHAVVGFTRAVATEIENSGVTINALCPGYVDTPMTERTLANVQERAGLPRERALAAVLATTGQERLVAPEEVAARALELCHDDARDVNGQAIRIGVEAPAR
jgi:NAD(P)-dependent dehydrogenase (short-subunit alcohol dehydrogenase family)